MNNKWQNAVRNMEQRMESLRLNMHGYQILYRGELIGERYCCLLYTSPSPRDRG